ncbi:Alpha/beta hydrolase fold-1 [Trinorchestia longiramus]|nr:Alpha/beta hydrolase fold-1 [Trinorchestia longiramus]
MSAYAASVTDKRTPRNRKTRHNNASKSKNNSNVLSSDVQTLSGLWIRYRLWRILVTSFEAYLTLMFTIFVSFYVLGKRLVSSRSAKGKRRNPYSLRDGRAQSGSYKDLSLATTGCVGADEESKVRPPKCLEDPALGTHKFIKIQGVKLHYVEAGAGRGRPTVLLIHGAFDFWFTWRRITPALAKCFRVISLDLRGCGDSEKPALRSKYSMKLLVEDIANFIRTLGDPMHDGPGGVSLISTGWGGQLGWRLAQTYPGLVRKMVLIHSPHPHVLASYYSPSLRNYFKLWPLFLARTPVVAEWVAAEENLGLVSRLLEPLRTAECLTEQEEEAYFYNFSRSEDITGALHHVRNWLPWDSVDGISSFSVLSTPTLLLMGDSDANLPVEAGYKSAEFVERIKTRVLPGAGSWAAITHHMCVLEELAAFFNEPRILNPCPASSDEDWDDNSASEEEDFGSSSSIMGRMMGASFLPRSVVSRWNSGWNSDNGQH